MCNQLVGSSAVLKFLSERGKLGDKLGEQGAVR